MKKELYLCAAAGLMAALFASTAFGQSYPDSDGSRPFMYYHKSQTYVIKPGALIILNPSSDNYFSLQMEAEYNVYGFFWVNLGISGAFNGDYISDDLHFGFTGKFGKARPFCPTFKADFLYRDFYPFEPNMDRRYVLGAVFGPGIRYYFPNRNAILLDILMEIGKYLKESKDKYMAIIPSIGFEF